MDKGAYRFTMSHLLFPLPALSQICVVSPLVASEASNHSLGVEPANKQSQTLRNRILAKIGRCVTVGFIASPVLVHSV